MKTVLNREFNTKQITRTGIIAAIYVTITFVFGFISYGAIQFRIAELLMLLCYRRKDTIPGITIGCLLANMLGPNGLPDIIFGTLATFISCILLYMTSMKLGENKVSLFLSSLWPVIVNAVIIGVMLNKMYSLPLLLTAGQVGIGEFGVVSVAGVALSMILKFDRTKLLN